MTLKELAIQVQQNQNNPNKLSELKITISAQYATWSEEISQIKANQKPNAWVKIKYKKDDGDWRDKPRSDTLTEQLWRTTEAGKKEVQLKYLLKGAEKLLSSIKDRLTVLGNEAYSTY